MNNQSHEKSMHVWTALGVCMLFHLGKKMAMLKKEWNNWKADLSKPIFVYEHILTNVRPICSQGYNFPFLFTSIMELIVQIII